MRTVGCPETSVTKYQSTLRKIPEERRSYFSTKFSLYVGLVLNCHYYTYDITISPAVCSSRSEESCRTPPPLTRITKQIVTYYRLAASSVYTRVGTLIVATIYLQLIQNRYMFRSFTVLQCSHRHCVQPGASDVEVVGYL